MGMFILRTKSTFKNLFWCFRLSQEGTILLSAAFRTVHPVRPHRGPHIRGPPQNQKKKIYIVQGSYRRFRNMKFKTFEDLFGLNLRPYMSDMQY